MGIKNFDILDKQMFEANYSTIMIRTEDMYVKEDGTNKKTYLANLLFYKDGYNPSVPPYRKLELHTTLPVKIKEKIAMVDVERDGVQLVFIEGDSGTKWYHTEPLERIQTYQDFKNVLAYKIANM